MRILSFVEVGGCVVETVAKTDHGLVDQAVDFELWQEAVSPVVLRTEAQNTVCHVQALSRDDTLESEILDAKVVVIVLLS